MHSLTTVPWSATLLRMGPFSTEFARSLELPLRDFRTPLPLITIVGLGVVVWWRSRRDGRATRRCVEVTVEMPSPYTLLYILGYLTVTLLVLDVWILTSLLLLALLGTCNFRLSTPKSTGVGSGPVVPETPLKTTSKSPHNITPPSSRRSKRLFRIHDEDEGDDILPVVLCNL
ncbi:hypothetical protein BDM02DRAFT_3162142 [Thelephora ganbajun]|uniref:Uncharacterized protein n=1 Tax=Thelephora ganbajun TaxID=370292 RepID=A0ACB6ZRY8_THEGA|nr:hypothetical protein BDM02DRAFT_3162142 [Thelephora ganbajun]